MSIKLTMKVGLLVFAPTRNCTHFLKIWFVVASGWFYSYNIHRGNKSDKEKKIVRTNLSFIHTKIFNKFFKRWVQFRVGAIPRLPWKSYQWLSCSLKTFHIFLLEDYIIIYTAPKSCNFGIVNSVLHSFLLMLLYCKSKKSLNLPKLKLIIFVHHKS